MRLGVVVLLVVLAAAGVLALLTAASTAAYFAGRASAGGNAAESYDVLPDARVALAMDQFRFAPGTLRVDAGALVEIALANRDDTLHTFSYALGEERFDHPVHGRSEAKVLVAFATPGEIAFWCEPHSAMRGTIVVEG